MADPRHELGRRGEELAAKHLVALGYRILGCNVVNKLGELDIVAVDGQTIVIVEVKARAKSTLAPSLAVNFRKQRKLIQVATLYLKEKGWLERSVRFDVVEVSGPLTAIPRIRHLKSAFTAL